MTRFKIIYLRLPVEFSFRRFLETQFFRQVFKNAVAASYRKI